MTSNHFENALSQAAKAPCAPDVYSVRFEVPTGCKLMVDAGAKLLSLANWLDKMTKRVRLVFDEGAVSMSYLERMGFFESLSPTIEVLPARPSSLTAAYSKGRNQRLIEFSPLSPKHVDKKLPSSLAEALAQATKLSGQKRTKLFDGAFTIFAELIDNVNRHSDTQLPGIAVAQCYSGKKVMVAVSDSGLGVIETLRPTLKSNYPELVDSSDTELVIKMVNEGVSRFGSQQGCGIRQCAHKAVGFNATMEFRMATSRIVFSPTKDKSFVGQYEYQDKLPLVYGTSVVFNFALD